MVSKNKRLRVEKIIKAGAAWYELKAWRWNSTITLDNPYTGSKSYQTRAHIDNLRAEFDRKDVPFVYMVYVTPSGVNIDAEVYDYARNNQVALIHLVAEYQIKDGQYHFRFVESISQK